MLRGVTGGLQVRPLRCQLGHKGQGGQSGNVQRIQLSGSAGGSRCSGLRSYQTGLRSRRPWSPPHRIYTSTPGRCHASVVSPTSLLLGYKSGIEVKRILHELERCLLHRLRDGLRHGLWNRGGHLGWLVNKVHQECKTLLIETWL